MTLSKSLQELEHAIACVELKWQEEPGERVDAEDDIKEAATRLTVILREHEMSYEKLLGRLELAVFAWADAEVGVDALEAWAAIAAAVRALEDRAFRAGVSAAEDATGFNVTKALEYER